MQLRYQKNLIKAQGRLAKITAITWSPQVSGTVTRMAVATSERVIHIFDENGTLRDSFATRPADKGQENYSIKSLAFSPCGTKLAVGQSDQIVYIYKLGSQWGEKKTIQNKFPLNSALLCMIWPHAKPTYIVVGLACGRVKICHLTSTMKSSTLYNLERSCISLAASPDGESFVSGHVDGSLVMTLKMKTPDETRKDLPKLDFAPVALGWGRDIAVLSGSARKVKFFTEQGREAQVFDLQHDKGLKPFSTLAFNPTGDCLIVGNCDKFLSFSYQAGKKRGTAWERGQAVLVPNLLTVSALAWRPDGAALITGSVAGAVDVFEVAARKVRHRSGLFELSYVSSSQCVVKILATGQSFSVLSASPFDKVDVLHERFIVARTAESFVVRDMLSNEVTEVIVGPVPPPPAKGATPLEVAAGQERIFLDHPGFVLVYTPGQVIVNRVGHGEPIGSVRTEFATSATTSVRVLQLPGDTEDTVVVATLQDPSTIQAVAVGARSKQLGVLTHDCPLDFLELSPRGDKILFRDYRKHMHVLDLATKQETTFLSQCSFAQWVPDADVIVAQANTTISVWYSTLPENAGNPIQIEVPDGCEAEAVERELGSASVVLRSTLDYSKVVRVLLDEALIAYREFSAKRDFAQAVMLLAAAPKTASIQASWKELAQVALSEGALAAAEAALAHAGDYAGSRFVYKTRKLKERRDASGLNGMTDPLVQARLAILQRDVARAEAVLVAAGEIEEAIGLHKDLGRWSDVLRLTEKAPGVTAQQAQAVRQRCVQDLEQQGHTDLAAEVYERDGQIVRAVEAFLRSGLAARAAALLSSHPDAFSANPSLSQEIAAKLEQAGLFDKAGELHELQGSYIPAIQAFRRGRAFDRALKLARQHSEAHVGQIRLEWAKWTREQGDVEGACARFVEAQAYPQAIETALQARMWLRAEKLLIEHAPANGTAAEDGVYGKLFAQLAEHYKHTGQAKHAAKFYLRAGRVTESVEVLLEAGDYSRALAVASENWSEAEVKAKFASLAENLEAEDKLAEAEQVYRAVDEVDRAILMYKNKGLFEQMIALVRQFYPEHVSSTLHGLAQMRQTQRSYEEAERLFVEAGLWTDAQAMYRQLDMWKDAVRVTRQHGKRNDAKRLLLERANALASSTVDVSGEGENPEGGVSDAGLRAAFTMLQEEGESDLCLDFMLQAGAYDEAVQLAKECKSNRITEIYLKRGELYEDRGLYQMAERDFILGRKPEDAVAMHLHRRDFESAMNVAERHCPDQRDAVLQARDHAMMSQGAQGLQGQQAAQGLQGQEQMRQMQEQLRQQHRQQQAQLAAAQQQQQPDNSAAPAAAGPVQERLQELVKGGQFTQALEIAQQHLPQSIPACLLQMIKATCKKRTPAPAEVAEAIVRFAPSGLTAVDRAEEALPALSKEVLDVIRLLSGGSASKGSPEEQRGPQALKKALLKLMAPPNAPPSYTNVPAMRDALRKHPLGAPAARCLMAAHLVGSRQSVASAGDAARAKGDAAAEATLRVAQAWMGASLMRYADVVSADYVFWRAGEAARAALEVAPSQQEAARLQALAYVTLNRFVDLYDVSNLEELQELEEDSRKDFACAPDVPPATSLRLPANGAASEGPLAQEIGGVRDLVLGWAVEGGAAKQLPVRACGGCANQDVFAASLQCASCGNQAEPCCVTGLPITKNRTECPGCHSGANAADWEAYVAVARRCPWCETQI